MLPTTILAAALVTAALRPEQVRIVTAEPAGCKFIEQQVCSSGRDNGVARCQKWHKIVAGKAGADTVYIIMASSADGFAATPQVATSKQSTSMTADYYSCGTDHPAAP